MSGNSEFEGILESLEHSKTGISGSKILKLTNLAMENVGENAQFITSVYKYAKRAPSTHKLGALYILDSIVRSFQDGAKKNNESFESPVDASFSGGWCKAAEVTESLVADAMHHAPSAHLPKILKLCDIWEKASTFHQDKLESLRSKIRQAIGSSDQANTSTPDTTASSAQANVENPAAATTSTTEPSAPSQPAGASTNDPASILEALAAFAQKAPAPSSTSTASGTPTAQDSASHPAPAAAASISPVPSATTSPLNPLPPQPVPSMPTPMYQPMAGIPPSMLGGPTVPNPAAPASDTESQKINLINVLASQNVPAPQIETIIKAAFPSYNAPFQGGPPAALSATAPSAGIMEPLHRSRSPSPRSKRAGRTPSPSQMSIPSAMPANGMPKPTPDGMPRKLERDITIPPDSIKVFSRTLFLGGITRAVREPVLRSMFERFGAVQSLILNHNYRHGFLKMFRREAAEKAQVAMENVPFADTTIRTKWGVGFGPRECSDFSSGVSIIPIRLLTDADRTWLVSAEYGGTGGLPITPGVAVDEPDIEIGLGISSKAISKRGKDLSVRRDDRLRGRKPFRGGLPHQGERHFDPSAGWNNGGAMPSNVYNPGYSSYYDPNYSSASGYATQPPWQPQ
ncbi:RNA-binding protein Seb1 [Schizosaccharomyces cryophilus OY26]|uniref:RNA-binding protein Seb1 n=1 Tax=Schizosaccharomyces cryophilus (strain OY26 / ATCC MYA-4695 / CBS 11777 / NBRC 106824 / NRRL Y48691) TaxID=653667 RepID=S9VWZ4_SCHCR|nr:RNA-binding protein Seb1 [Schizosaccharomyces cryophilus OY26]EPY50759.1 RNA-binding protein Seb1 [Schizosaccharomyces cryophilus OY26]